MNSVAILYAAVYAKHVIYQDRKAPVLRIPRALILTMNAAQMYVVLVIHAGVVMVQKMVMKQISIAAAELVRHAVTAHYV
jgi:hypothetical protein